ncbi:MAG: fumarate reductase flavoprotein subunit, partial [Bacillota bacterium]|nr:fumarate reductase flavoprotein subunit [Bacillota bacterium]
MRNKLFRALSFTLAVFLTLGLTGCETSKDFGQSSAGGSGKDYDVVVVGAGLGGLTSAVAAAENGAKVALLEKLAFAGGNSILSTGIFYVGNTSIQRNAGIKDSAEAFYKDAMDKSGGRRDPEQVRMIAERGGETIDWLMSLGVKFSDKVTPVMGSSAPRAHQALPDASGPISALVKAAESKGVEIFYETPAVALITDGNGKVTGVEAKNKEGQVLKFNAKNVVLAVGGFAADPERLAKYTPAAKGVIYAGSPGTTGEMLDEALKLGADTVDLDVPWLTPTVEVDKKQLITSLVLSKGAILVNSQGRRFSDETASYAETAQKVLELGEPFVYEVFDSRVKELVYKVPEYIKKGMV